MLWAREPHVATRSPATTRTRPTTRASRLPDAIDATADPAAALAGAELVVLAVPSQTLRANLAGWSPMLPADAVLVSLLKGIELGTMSG